VLGKNRHFPRSIGASAVGRRLCERPAERSCGAASPTLVIVLVVLFALIVAAALVLSSVIRTTPNEANGGSPAAVPAANGANAPLPATGGRLPDRRDTLIDGITVKLLRTVPLAEWEAAVNDACRVAKPKSRFGTLFMAAEFGPQANNAARAKAFDAAADELFNEAFGESSLPDDPVGLDDARSAFNHYVDAYEALRSVATQLYAGADGNVQLEALPIVSDLTTAGIDLTRLNAPQCAFGGA